jgi:oligopeptide transport system ATP-binding protein
LQDAGNGHMVRCVRWAEIQKGEAVGA